MSIQILSNQIISDYQSLSKDMEAGLADKNHVESELARIHDKLKEWELEANEIIEEANITDSLANSEQEFRAERSAEENN